MGTNKKSLTTSKVGEKSMKTIKRPINFSDIDTVTNNRPDTIRSKWIGRGTDVLLSFIYIKSKFDSVNFFYQKDISKEAMDKITISFTCTLKKKKK